MLMFYVFAMINQIDVFICTHFFQVVIQFLCFMLMLVFSGNNVEIRDITSWGFSRHDQVINRFCNISCIFIWRMSLVPTWKIIWSGLSRITGLIRSITYILSLHREMALRRHCRFQPHPPITYRSMCLMILSPTTNTCLLLLFFSTWVFFHEHSRFTGQHCKE